jgi:hypothetical protein
MFRAERVRGFDHDMGGTGHALTPSIGLRRGRRWQRALDHRRYTSPRSDALTHARRGDLPGF